MLAAGFVLAGALGVPGAGDAASPRLAACSARTGCAACLAPGGSDDALVGRAGLEPACFWCASTSTCMEAQAQLWSPFHECPDPSTDARVCGCTTAVQSSSCSACMGASENRYGCVWLPAGVEYITAVAVRGSAVRQAVVMETVTDPHGKCWPGNAIGPVARSADLSLPSTDAAPFTLEAVSTLFATEFYWGQCRVQGPAYVGSLVTLAALAALALCVVALCALSPVATKQDRRSHGGSVVAEGRLLSEDAAAQGAARPSVVALGSLLQPGSAQLDGIIVGRAIVPTML